MKIQMNLNPIEKAYKSFYNTTGISTKEHALSISDFASLIQKERLPHNPARKGNPTPSIDSDSLNENSYFQEKQDISAIRHIRYLPAAIHTHEFFEIACVLKGTFTNFIGDNKMELHTGDIFILSPNTPHAICTYEDDAVLINLLMRTSTFEQHFLSLLPNNDILYSFFLKALYGTTTTPYLLFHTGEDSILAEYVLKILHEFERNNRYKNTMLSSLVSIFFVHLLRVHDKDIVIPTLQPWIMNETTVFILEYMQKNYTTITLSHLSDFFNYSERQMNRIIKTATGMTFGENIKKLRMNHAARLLSESSTSIRTIAELLGYYDVSNFRKIFKSYYGMTPSQYRDKKSS